MAMIRAVLFDMGGTLINYPSPNDLRELCYEHADEIGIDKEILGEAIRLFSERRRHGKDSREEALVGEAIRSTLSERKIAVNADYVKDVLWKIFLVGFSRHASVVEGAGDVLGGLHKAGRILGIVSNTPFPGVFHLHDFRRFGLPTESFRTFVWSSEFGRRKPGAEIFNRALLDIGVQPEHAVHVGDKMSRDVEGALAAGITPVWFDRKNDGRNHAGYKITSLHELPRLIDEIEQGLQGQ